MNIKKCVRDILVDVKQAALPVRKQYHFMMSSKDTRGSTAWLIDTEDRFGGYVTNVKRNKVGSKDTRTAEELAIGGMTGGDRMLYHNYGPHYSHYLQPFLGKEDAVLAEVGILKGTGLAIWCDLFPKGRVMGFDIDLGHTQNNTPNLKQRGAFKQNEPELYEYDQFLDNRDYVGSVLKDDKIDICIDDGVHSDESILSTMASFMPHLADDFVYFVEDNRTAHKKIAAEYPHLNVDSKGRLTIITPKRS